MTGLSRQFVCILLLAVTVLASRRLADHSSQPFLHLSDAVPLAFDGWTGSDDPQLDKEVARQLSADDYLFRTYKEDLNSVGLFIAYYARQRLGADIHPPKDCLPGNGWNIVDYRILEIAKDKPINIYSIQNGDDRRLVLYWYQSGGRVLATELDSKLLLFWHAIENNDTSGMVARIIVEDSPEALAQGTHFAAALITALENAKSQVRLP